MRLRLDLARASWLALAAVGLTLLVLAAILPGRAVRAEDRITLQGNYFREASTRVLAPTIDIEMDLPDERFTLGGSYLLDAVSSASIAAGAAAVTGGDAVFTELRHQAALRVRSKLDGWTFGGFFRYSSESDYISRAFGLNVSRELFEKSGTLSLAYSGSFDRVLVIRPSFRDTVPWISPSDPAIATCEAEDPTTCGNNLLQSHYFNVGYGHALHRTVLAGLNLEVQYIHGPQENPYRRVDGAFFQAHPYTRRRFAPNAFIRWALPRAEFIVFEQRYRLHVDDWGVLSHTTDTRLHFRIAKILRLRLRYSFYTQKGANFWIPMTERPYPADAELMTSDPKLSAFMTHTPGIQLTVELKPLARFRGLRWLDGAWVQATYNHIFPVTDHPLDYYYGNARLGSLAFSVPF